ncbi:hypothetical protein ACAX43_25535 [Paraburkholderia sp. IW21]|uniref:hypothetical protein n=1 Tax=Paraburkholderia sp. IW21 TaxID=3242488 RepID=UPI003520F11A
MAHRAMTITHNARKGQGDIHNGVTTAVSAGPASATTPGSIYAYNVNGITLNNVMIGSTTYNNTVVNQR